MQYDMPSYKEGKSDCYVSFNAFDPVMGKMRRKRIKINHIQGTRARREYAKDLIKRLVEQLRNGWNPWICKDISNLRTFNEAVERYDSHLDKMYSEGLYRKETYVGYKSFIKNLSYYASSKNRLYYVYQFDKAYCSNFLDYIFIDRGNCAQTRNNYLNFLRIFSGFLVDKGYLQSKPTDTLAPISKRLIKKTRSDIPYDKVREIAEHLKREDPHFLLACYLLFYCFIRPVEMTRLKISDIDLHKGTITIQESVSKNKKKQVVTIPKKVITYSIDLGIFSAPASDFIFSNGLKPGTAQIDTKIFRDHWAKVKKALKLPNQYKFYSLKDTGITEMLEKNMSTISVRDQARHSSLAITDIYTRKGIQRNEDIFEIDGSL